MINKKEKKITNVELLQSINRSFSKGEANSFPLIRHVRLWRREHKGVFGEGKPLNQTL